MDKPTGPAPIYLLAGGPGTRRKGGDPLFAQVLRSYGIPHPSVAYVGAASGDNKAFFLMITTFLRACGAGKVTLAPFTSKRANVEKTKEIIGSADIVFISGGDVEVGIQVVKERQVIPFLRQLYEAGKPFLGVSAGSIMLAREWVRWEDPDDDATIGTFACMGFADVLCDTHGEAEGWEELQALLRLEPEGALGYGIPSGAGLCVCQDGQHKALGAPVQCYAHYGDAVVRCTDLLP
jgi:peptidase E